MSKLDQEAYTPATTSIKFRIPLYQRPYAWGILQVEQLLKDLHLQFRKSNTQKYYIGILNVGKAYSNHELYDLIDGQQRITTICLIGKVLEEFYPKWNEFLRNRLDLYGRPEDQLYLDKLDNSRSPNPQMIEVVNKVKEFIEQHRDKESFAKYVYEKAAFFITEVPEQYTLLDKNLQFVRMNNRGKQLEAHDILKIKLISFFSSHETQLEYLKKWNAFSQLGCSNNLLEFQDEKSLSDILNITYNIKEPERETEIFYQSIVSFPEFLLIALARFFKKNNINITVSHTKEKQSDNYRKDKLLEEFGFGENKIEFNWTQNHVTGFLNVLEKQFDLFDRFIIKRDKEDKYKLSDKYKDNLTGSSLLELQVFQSFLYVSREPYQYNWVIDAIDFLEENTPDNKIDTTLFLNKLKDIDNSRYRENDSLSLNYGKIDRYWFWRLDYYLWENKDLYFKDKAFEIAKKYVFRINRSIEHIAPQHPKTFTSVFLSDDIKDGFGNLAMISSGQNSSLQNESFEVKRAHVESYINGSKIGTIESLKMLKIYEFENWNADTVNEHSDTMIKVLINSFTDECLIVGVLKAMLHQK
ncbi:MAG TPA: DUF262 domain-containing HNH endonuclease family protein [Tenuifilaceae bacterium]|nr:DUF262 domain-containing HNH endonuclease family protein [Tenuifilaceae bacterium]